ncbi:hypothetical protein N9Z02_01735 [Akkermansiaceae bacterium]|nr:hypothetical protein [Akkermansiaceae bacterium]
MVPLIAIGLAVYRQEMQVGDDAMQSVLEAAVVLGLVLVIACLMLRSINSVPSCPCCHEKIATSGRVSDVVENRHSIECRRCGDTYRLM